MVKVDKSAKRGRPRKTDVNEFEEDKKKLFSTYKDFPFLAKWHGMPSIKTMIGPSGKQYVLDSQVYVGVSAVDAEEFKTCSGFEIIENKNFKEVK